jgi:hypothetical protein
MSAPMHDPRIPLRHNNEQKVIDIKGRMFATAHMFFDDGDETPVAEIRSGSFWFFKDTLSQAAMRRRDKLQAESLGRLLLDPLPDISEKAFERRLVQRIKAIGLKCRQQVRCGAGIIDIFVDGEPTSIIEAKAAGDIGAMRLVAHQLIQYGQHFPKARLFVAAPGPIDVSAVRFLAEKGIGIWS